VEMRMKPEKLLNEIFNCSEIGKAINDETHPCNAIVNLQKKNRHCPEPWTGDIVNCEVLFVSSNPSINKNEYYPSKEGRRKIEIDEFFTCRFNADYGFTQQYNWGFRARLNNGNDLMAKYSRGVSYWSRIWAYALFILHKKNKNDVIPGSSYALTEIVHCKSEKEKGVKQAMTCCSGKYLTKIMEITKV